jgi:Coenzyme PQQ synthesis protein D (PqqD)
VTGKTASTFDSRSIVSSATNIPFSRLDDDLLALDEQAGYCYSLNASAARVWELVATPTSVGSICDVLCTEFAVDRDTCLRDVCELLSALLEAGFIKVTHATVA